MSSRVWGIDRTSSNVAEQPEKGDTEVERNCDKRETNRVGNSGKGGEKR